MTQTIQEIIEGWDRGDGKPMKSSLIDWAAHERGDGVCAMCAQGQILVLAGGWDYTTLRDTDQSEADAAFAKLLNISRAHAILLRNINDKVDGAPSIVLTDPGKVLGDQWSKLLDLWWMFDNYTSDEWRAVRAARGSAAARAAAWESARAAAAAAAWESAREAARATAWESARAAAGEAAWEAAREAAREVAGEAAWEAAREVAGEAAREAAWEIQGHTLMVERKQKPFFLPMCGIATPADIPARPADYGNGIVPRGE